jgi:enoyl-CoA hydratase
MSSSTVILSRKEHIATVTLNRPEADNAINQQLARELAEVCLEINQDNSIYAVIVTGAGNKAFCCGSESEKSIRASKTKKVAKNLGTPYIAATAIASLDRPVIAAVNGDALGQGLELALACDIRLASDKARFGLPQVSLGLMPMDGGTQHLPRIVGRGKALELIFTGATITAREALEIGLVSRVVAQKNLASEAEALAQNMASKAPIALKFIKEAVNKGLDLTLDQGLRLEADLYFLLHTTADRTEGIRAFLEKRNPKFKGK